MPPDNNGYFLGPESPCRYKPDKLARKAFMALPPKNRSMEGNMLREYMAGHLTPYGFWRQNDSMGIPFCRACNACVPYRIIATEFKPGANMKKGVIKPNASLTAFFNANAILTGEHTDLFRKYLRARHAESDMKNFSDRDINAALRSASGIVEFRAPTQKLLGVMLVDIVTAPEPNNEGVAAIQSFFDPEESEKCSLGTFMILKLIEMTRNSGRRNLYMGAWIDGYRKMDYKKRFRPAEVLTRNGWELFDPEKHTQSSDTGCTLPAPKLQLSGFPF